MNNEIQKLPEGALQVRLEQLRTERSKSGKHYYFESKFIDGEKQLADDLGTEAYAAIIENPFLTPAEQPLSTFSVDVDTASYANVRRFLNQGQLPPADAVRIEELVNYFKYDDPAPADGQPFRVVAEAAPCPWQREHYVARISLKAKEIAKQQRPPTNLVFLLDVSGSMQPDNKLPLVKRAMSLLIEELGERDRVSIVTYAGDAGLKLEPTIGSDQTKIMQAIEALSAGGSTNGAAGIQLAYEQALRHFSKESANRVILCTDGDFNVGISSDDELVKLIEAQAKSGVFLSIFGFGMGNLKDSKLEKLADKGNGHYGYIDDLNEARKNFNEELMGTLYTVAKDVKLQVEFNPLTVGAYRLIGYENRVMAAEDFNNDAKDAGEIGAGHTVTALYEIVPRGKWQKAQAVDPLKYTATEPAPKAVEPKANVSPESADDLFTVKLRYKQPDAAASVRTVDVVVDDIAGKKVTLSRDLLWSASVASFGMQLRHSKHAGTWTMADVLETARGAKGDDTTGRRGEFVELVKATMKL
ncbi:MAG: VWA domain-containing protein, partial [Candidatus Saccharimonas sp.]|nr:VWA domain-containing protein [Planctomycetaceae bacterium]